MTIRSEKAIKRAPQVGLRKPHIASGIATIL
jgi:hypothetical protein